MEIENGIKEPIDLNEVSGYNKANANKKKKNTNELDNDAFMKLFLEQLKNQDPTAPMETDKIITQTAQLTQVEMQEQTKQTMIEVAEAMQSTKATNEELKNFQASMKETLEALALALGKDSVNKLDGINLIGKIAETKINALNKEEGPIDFEIYFDEKIDSNMGNPKIIISNANKEVIREIDISSMDGEKGYLKFNWDGKDSNGDLAPRGEYSVIANYNFTKEGSYNVARVGRGEVESVIFDDGVPNLRMGELIIPLEEAIEFYSRNEK